MDRVIIKIKPKNEKWVKEMKKYIDRLINGIQSIFDFMVAQEIYYATVTGDTLAFDFLISSK